MLKLVFAVLFAVIALNEANNYQYNYNQQRVRQLSGRGYGPSVQLPKPTISLKVPTLPKQSQYQSYQPPATTQTPPPPPPPPAVEQYQSYQQAPAPAPAPTLVQFERIPTLPKQSQYQSYQPPATTQTPPPPPPPPAVEQYQSYQQAPAPVQFERVITQVKQQQYQPSIQVVPKAEPSYGQAPSTIKITQQSSYGSSSYGSGLSAGPSNPCIGRVPEEKLADPSNPSQFIVCLEEEQFTIMQCPINLVFNPNTLRCENTLRMVRACAANPCQNEGICTDLAAGQFRCDCQPNWTGDFCEKLDVCPPNACGPSGVCIPLAQGSPLPKFCLCNGGQSFGTDCNVVEPNPCLTNDAELHTFPTRTNPAIFAHCEGNIPHLKFCLYPLVYSHELQRCDWAQSPDPVESSSSSGYGY